eukprot:gene43649-biopygen29835
MVQIGSAKRADRDADAGGDRNRLFTGRNAAVGKRKPHRFGKQRRIPWFRDCEHGRKFFAAGAREDRSLMNVPFKLSDESLDEAFLKGAQARGMLQLKGHRSVGGMRASIYNAMSLAGVQALVAYMKEFEAGRV